MQLPAQYPATDALMPSALRALFLCLSLLLLPPFAAASLVADDFSLLQRGTSNPGTTLLIVAGIDGDEPGGFHAAATLATRYRISGGQLWIVPDFHARAIRKRVRGDINLKFAAIASDDPLFAPVERIKQIVTAAEVDLVINLHDGSGFYHPTRIDRQRNPWRWGQSIVIDQEELPGVPFGELHRTATAVLEQINRQARSEAEFFQVKNMRTATLPATAAAPRSLSYFAVQNGKPALSIEASKTHPVYLRTYYHLLAIEALMKQAGISFTRDFQLNPAAVDRVLREDARMTLAHGRIFLDLNAMRRELADFPLPAQAERTVAAANPLISLQPEGEQYRIHYGNNRLALLHPRRVELDPAPQPVAMTIDGVRRQVEPGGVVAVRSQVQVSPAADVRISVVGLDQAKTGDDGMMVFDKKALDPRASIDRAGELFRLEIYRAGRFSGMILLDFRS